MIILRSTALRWQKYELLKIANKLRGSDKTPLRYVNFGKKVVFLGFMFFH
jgi:hypothetical protein